MSNFFFAKKQYRIRLVYYIFTDEIKWMIITPGLIRSVKTHNSCWGESAFKPSLRVGHWKWRERSRYREIYYPAGQKETLFVNYRLFQQICFSLFFWELIVSSSTLVITIMSMDCIHSNCTKESSFYLIWEHPLSWLDADA